MEDYLCDMLNFIKLLDPVWYGYIKRVIFEPMLLITFVGKSW